MQGTWAVVGDVLGIKKPDGEFWVPEASLVFDARFGMPGETELPDLANGAIAATLRFERYPASLELAVLQPSQVSGKLSTLLRVVTEGQPHVVSGDRLLLGGHIVIDDRWVPIAPHHLEEYRELVSVIGSDLFSGLTLKQYLQLRLISEPGGLFRADDVSAHIEAPGSIPQLARAPSDLDEKLYPYQKTGADWLRWLAAQQVGGLLADEMGLGKTIQLIAFLTERTAELPAPNLVVGTSSILENWRRELQRFAPQLKVLIHQGGARTGSPSMLRTANVVVTSYDTLVRDTVLFGQVAWNAVVVDEAQFLKNPDTLRSSAARRLKRELTIAATGTPIENSLKDLWSLIDLTLPGFLGDQNVFLASFPDEPSAATRLATITKPVVLRRRVSEVAKDLPPRIDIPTALVFSETEALRYEALRKELTASGAGSFAAVTKLRMFCAHPGLIDDTTGDPAISSIKYSRLVEVITEIFLRNEKAIVFASFKKMIDIIRDDIRKRYGGFVSHIDGRTPIADRQPMIDEFSKVHGSALLVLNPRAAGVGLNVSAANHVIHYTLEWNPAVEDQASARAYRRGQTLPVTIHRLFYTDSVEEVMDQRIQAKRVLMDRGVITNKGEEINMQDVLAALRKSPIHATA